MDAEAAMSALCTSLGKDGSTGDISAAVTARVATEEEFLELARQQKIRF